MKNNNIHNNNTADLNDINGSIWDDLRDQGCLRTDAKGHFAPISETPAALTARQYLTPLEWKPGWFNSPCKYFPFFCPCCMAHDFLDHLPDSCLTLQTVQSPTSNHPQSLMWLWPVFLKLLTPSLMLLQRHAIINNLGHTQLFLLPSLTHFTKQSHPIEHRAISNWRVLPFSQVRR